MCDPSTKCMCERALEEQGKVLKLSHQSMGAFMLCLQKCLSEEIDMVELLRELDFEVKDGELVVTNPPVVSVLPE